MLYHVNPYSRLYCIALIIIMYLPGRDEFLDWHERASEPSCIHACKHNRPFRSFIRIAWSTFFSSTPQSIPLAKKTYYIASYPLIWTSRSTYSYYRIFLYELPIPGKSESSMNNILKCISRNFKFEHVHYLLGRLWEKTNSISHARGQ